MKFLTRFRAIDYFAIFGSKNNSWSESDIASRANVLLLFSVDSRHNMNHIMVKTALQVFLYCSLILWYYIVRK
jgi:hypothetical protein